MREVLHAFAAAAVLVVAALCTLVQLSNVSNGFDRLGQHEQTVIQQVSSDAGHQTGKGSGGGAGHDG